jgi:hypothetical protein
MQFFFKFLSMSEKSTITNPWPQLSIPGLHMRTRDRPAMLHLPFATVLYR